MCLLSISYEKTYERVFALTGLPLGSFTFLYLRAEDKQRMWRRRHQNKVSVKMMRMEKFYKKIREGGQKSVQDNAKGLSYKSGMMGPGSTTTTTSNKRQRRSIGCPHCGFLTHRRITSKLCQKIRADTQKKKKWGQVKMGNRWSKLEQSGGGEDNSSVEHNNKQL
jgi:hypothetical protein